MEIQKYHRLLDLWTYGLTWVGARDTCASKKTPHVKNDMLYFVPLFGKDNFVNGWVGPIFSAVVENIT